MKPKTSDESTEDKTRPMSLRVSLEFYNRVMTVAQVSRRKPAAVLYLCAEDHLPEMEKELGIKPGEPPGDRRTVI